MKKILFLLVATVMFGAITSCASTKVEEKAADKIPAVVGAEGIERPLWVLSGRESEDGIYAVGSGKMSTRANSLKVAILFTPYNSKSFNSLESAKPSFTP